MTWIRMALTLTAVIAAASSWPVEAAVVKPPIHIGSLQYTNVAGTAGNYSGYEADAMEMHAARALAVRDLNSGKFVEAGIEYLINYTITLDYRNTLYSLVETASLAIQMMDSLHNPAVPSVVLGFVGYDEALQAAVSSQPYQTPLLTSFVSTPSLTANYPNFNRYCVTDETEANALLAVFATFNWQRVATIYNSGGGSSSELVQAIQEVSAIMYPQLKLMTTSYSFSLLSPLAFPNVRPQLQSIKDSGLRIILLSAFSSDVPMILLQAAELGMIGAPYQWIGSSEWCFDEDLWTNPLTGHLLDGALCTNGYVGVNSTYYQYFEQSWAEAYAADPDSVYHIHHPTVSAAAYDTVIGAAHAMQTVLNLRKACDLPPEGANGVPLSGLIPPDLSEFTLGMYQAEAVQTLEGAQRASTQSTVPMTYPDVCPFLLYQVGQGRVLSQILRNQHTWGVTGQILLSGSGDRLGDLVLYNLMGGVRTEIGRISSLRIYALLDGTGLNFTQIELNNPSLSSLGDGFDPSAYLGGEVRNADIVPNATWRSSYDPATFRPTGYYRTVTTEYTMHPGSSLGSHVFLSYHPERLLFADGTSHVPLDEPVRVEMIVGATQGARIAIFVLVGVLALCTLGLIAFQIAYRRNKVIKATSPRMNLVFLVGTLGILCYIVLLGLDSSDLQHGVDGYVGLCHVKWAILSISFSLAFGSLFAKTYRLDSIFNSKHLHVHIVKDRDILWMVAKLVLLDILILVIWDGASPLHRSVEFKSPYANPENIDQLLVPTHEFCESQNFTIFIAVFLVYKGLVLVAGLFLALRVRKIKMSGMNDSKYIVMAIYNVVLLSSILIGVSIVVRSDPTAFYLIVGLGLVFLVTAVLCLLFLPRVLTVCCGMDLMGERPSPSNPSPKEDTGSSLNSDQTRAEMKNLRLRIAAVQAEMNEARKQMHAAGIVFKPPPPLPPSTEGSGGAGGAAVAAGGSGGSGHPSPMLRPTLRSPSPVLRGQPSPHLVPTPSGSRRVSNDHRSPPPHGSSPAAAAHRQPSTTLEHPAVRIHFHDESERDAQTHAATATTTASHHHHHASSGHHHGSSASGSDAGTVLELTRLGSGKAAAASSSPAPVPRHSAVPSSVRLPGLAQQNSQLDESSLEPDAFAPMTLASPSAAAAPQDPVTPMTPRAATTTIQPAAAGN